MILFTVSEKSLSTAEYWRLERASNIKNQNEKFHFFFVKAEAPLRWKSEGTAALTTAWRGKESYTTALITFLTVLFVAKPKQRVGFLPSLLEKSQPKWKRFPAQKERNAWRSDFRDPAPATLRRQVRLWTISVSDSDKIKNYLAIIIKWNVVILALRGAREPRETEGARQPLSSLSPSRTGQKPFFTKCSAVALSQIAGSPAGKGRTRRPRSELITDQHRLRRLCRFAVKRHYLWVTGEKEPMDQFFTGEFDEMCPTKNSQFIGWHFFFKKKTFQKISFGRMMFFSSRYLKQTSKKLKKIEAKRKKVKFCVRICHFSEKNRQRLISNAFFSKIQKIFLEKSKNLLRKVKKSS